LNARLPLGEPHYRLKLAGQSMTHDLNARAMSPRVKGFVQAQNWFQNFSGISVER
jgi:hypothetical protein